MCPVPHRIVLDKDRFAEINPQTTAFDFQIASLKEPTPKKKKRDT
jgi:hypothetical protein